jgi:hypothetical protein
MRQRFDMTGNQKFCKAIMWASPFSDLHPVPWVLLSGNMERQSFVIATLAQNPAEASCENTKARLVWRLKFNQHCSSFVLFNKKFLILN